MNIKEIKDAINNGKKVYWHHKGYEVIKDNIGQYLIHCNINDTYIGLYGHQEVPVLNGAEKDFYSEVA
jgi:hypothetical protein